MASHLEQQQQQQEQQQQREQQQEGPKKRELAGTVVVLQHPHETKKALATVPLLGFVLQPASLLRLVGRRLRAGTAAAFDELLGQAQQAGAPVMVLWPGPGAQCISDVQLPQLSKQPCKQCSRQQQAQDCVAQQPSCRDAHHPQQQEPQGTVSSAGGGLAYVLVVVDGTWQQAKEMFSVLQPWLLGPSGCAVQVQLPLTCTQGSSAAAAGGTTVQHSPSIEQPPAVPKEQQTKQSSRISRAAAAAADAAAGVASLSLQPDPTCRLRTEPHEGCTTTYEAIAQAVSHLEAQCWQQQQQQQADLLARLLRPLQLMTQLQASFDPAVAKDALTEAANAALDGLVQPLLHQLGPAVLRAVRRGDLSWSEEDIRLGRVELPACGPQGDTDRAADAVLGMYGLVVRLEQPVQATTCTTLATAVQQHPHAFLRAVEAGLRQLTAAHVPDAGLISKSIVALAVPKWLVKSLAAPSFWATAVPPDQQGSAADTDDLMLAGLSFAVAGRALHGYLQDSSSSFSGSDGNSNRGDTGSMIDQMWHPATGGAAGVSGDGLAKSLVWCLQHVGWVGEQLQELVLPGNQQQAEAALQALEKQEQQLRVALMHAIQQLSASAAAAAAAAAVQAFKEQQC
ncbi:hypothetical protein COO60DRAFT_1699852 [Scenedesmus sp. NREL 46B-D3]|nr:hypothetical protein COO60DRAFT_1699852 [Scenedesmus sp. NREL 46B-D3]